MILSVTEDIFPVNFRQMHCVFKWRCLKGILRKDKLVLHFGSLWDNVSDDLLRK